MDKAAQIVGYTVIGVTAILIACALVSLVLNRIWQTLRQTYDVEYMREALRHYETIKPQATWSKERGWEEG